MKKIQDGFVVSIALLGWSGSAEGALEVLGDALMTARLHAITLSQASLLFKLILKRHPGRSHKEIP